MNFSFPTKTFEDLVYLAECAAGLRKPPAALLPTGVKAAIGLDSSKWDDAMRSLWECREKLSAEVWERLSRITKDGDRAAAITDQDAAWLVSQVRWVPNPDAPAGDQAEFRSKLLAALREGAKGLLPDDSYRMRDCNRSSLMDFRTHWIAQRGGEVPKAVGFATDMWEQATKWGIPDRAETHPPTYMGDLDLVAFHVPELQPSTIRFLGTADFLGPCHAYQPPRELFNIRTTYGEAVAAGELIAAEIRKYVRQRGDIAVQACEHAGGHAFWAVWTPEKGSTGSGLKRLAVIPQPEGGYRAEADVLAGSFHGRGATVGDSIRRLRSAIAEMAHAFASVGNAYVYGYDALDERGSVRT